MTLLGTIVSLFPAFHLTLVLSNTIWTVYEPTWWKFVMLPIVLYLVPPLCFRVHEFLFPLKTGVHRLDTKEYSPWWGGHQMQQIFYAIPQLETVLRLVPGLYSAWLRLWGAKVGRGVHWSSTVLVGDHSLLHIGDRVVFGHHVEMWSHLIKTKNGRVTLFTGMIEIGNDVFVSGYVRIGLGANVNAGTWIPGDTDVYMGKVIPRATAALEVPQ